MRSGTSMDSSLRSSGARKRVQRGLGRVPARRTNVHATNTTAVDASRTAEQLPRRGCRRRPSRVQMAASAETSTRETRRDQHDLEPDEAVLELRRPSPWGCSAPAAPRCRHARAAAKLMIQPAHRHRQRQIAAVEGCSVIEAAAAASAIVRPAFRRCPRATVTSSGGLYRCRRSSATAARRERCRRGDRAILPRGPTPSRYPRERRHRCCSSSTSAPLCASPADEADRRRTAAEMRPPARTR